MEKQNKDITNKDLKSNNEEFKSNKKIMEMALDIMKVSSLPLEISGAIATDLTEIGYRKQEWISVEDRLPNDYQEVIVYSANIEFNIFTYQGNNEWRNEQGMTFETEDSIITHWLPLPPKPKMKGAD